MTHDDDDYEYAVPKAVVRHRYDDDEGFLPRPRKRNNHRLLLVGILLGVLLSAGAGYAVYFADLAYSDYSPIAGPPMSGQRVPPQEVRWQAGPKDVHRPWGSGRPGPRRDWNQEKGNRVPPAEFATPPQEPQGEH